MIAMIRMALNNSHAVFVLMLTIIILGALALTSIPIDILPTNSTAAVQVLTFYSGMPASMVEKNLSNRLERWTGQAAGTEKQESRSIVGCSIVRNYYRDGTDPSGALTQVASLASVAGPYLPPGTLPPVVLPFDPTATTPVCLVALDSKKHPEAILTDTGRFEVRNMIMSLRGAVAPVVYGGKTRAVLAYLNREQLQARDLSPLDVMGAIDNYNIFMPTGGAKFGEIDYALDSNSMYDFVERMGEIPVKSEGNKTVFLKDVASPKDASLSQASCVRVNGLRQVYIPVYRQQGTSTLSVVNDLKQNLPDFKTRLTYDDIDLKMVLDQSVYVQHSIHSLAEEGILGAILCSLVILLFLGDWRMTIIAVITIPICVLLAMLGLFATANTINVMTLAGLALAIGPLVDSAIIVLENTHRHLGLGVHQKEAALYGSGEVAMPALVATCCTLLVLAPLAFVPGMGKFLFRPMAWAVTFSMLGALLLAWTLVPCLCSMWLRGHGPRHQEDEHHGPDFSHRSEHENAKPKGWLGKAYERWESLLGWVFGSYATFLARVIRVRSIVVGATVVALVATIVGLGPLLKREFFPEVDAGTIEMFVRAKSGTRLEETEKRIEAVEEAVKEVIGHDLEIVISEIGVVADWSAAYSANSGPMDSAVKIQLHHDRKHSAQEYAHKLRQAFQATAWSDLEFAFDTGGMIRSAMNEGKSTPINIQITARNVPKAYQVAQNIQLKAKQIPGVVDCRIQQRLDYPQYVVEVDQAKASALGVTQTDVMRNLVAAMNSSIQFHKKNFWIDPVSNNQYYVGVAYPEADIESFETLLDIPITSPKQKRSIPLRNVATLRRANIASEVSHRNLQTTIDLGMGVYGRDLGKVSDDITRLLSEFGQQSGEDWKAYDPTTGGDAKQLLVGSTIRLTGEYRRMQDTFRNLGIGLALASLLIYFLMVALFKSWITPLVIISAVPVGLIGVVIMLLITGTAINVQSLLGVIFMVGIVVSNTVLMVDFAQHLRRTEKLSPLDAILKSAAVRVRPVVMTALAAFFALLPMALGLARGSEANTPLGRAVVGGLVAGLATTLFVVPALYVLMVREDRAPKRPIVETTPIA